jgi:hypothetical protein
MALSCFDDRASQPTKEAIAKVLGSTSALWFELVQMMAAHYPPIEEEWAFSGAQYGWSLRLIHKKRRVLYLIPQAGAFLVGVVLGEKAVAAANRSPLAQAVLDEINSARKYAEGRGIRWRVQSQEDLHSVELLAAIKMSH